VGWSSCCAIWGAPPCHSDGCHARAPLVSVLAAPFVAGKAPKTGCVLRTSGRPPAAATSRHKNLLCRCVCASSFGALCKPRNKQLKAQRQSCTHCERCLAHTDPLTRSPANPCATCRAVLPQTWCWRPPLQRPAYDQHTPHVLHGWQGVLRAMPSVDVR
jgi:hypothetical protein